MDIKTAVLFILLMAQTPEDMEFNVMKEQFVSGEQVCFTFSNQRRQAVQLPSPHPWMIVDEKGGIVFSPMTAQVIVPVEPASMKHWCWDQRRNNGQLVDPGRYVVKMNAYVENKMHSFSRIIKIMK